MAPRFISSTLMHWKTPINEFGANLYDKTQYDESLARPLTPKLAMNFEIPWGYLNSYYSQDVEVYTKYMLYLLSLF